MLLFGIWHFKESPTAQYFTVFPVEDCAQTCGFYDLYAELRKLASRFTHVEEWTAL